MILKEYVNLRDTLSQVAYDNNNFATLASGVIPSDLSTNSKFQYDGIITRISNQNLIIQGPEDDLSFTISTAADHLADIVPGTSYAVSDILTAASSTGDLYSALALLTQKYSYSERINIDTLNNIISTSTNDSTPDYDIRALKDNLMAISDNDGFVSSKAWIVCLRDWFNECKISADNQSTELDQTAPNTLSGLYSVVITAVGTVISVIFTALSVVFGAVFLIIGQILAFVFNSLSNYFSEQGEININAPNLFTKGVAKACDQPWSGGLEVDCRDDYSINYLDLPSCGLFYWKSNVPGQIRINAYLQPTFSPVKVLAFITDSNMMILADARLDFISNTGNVKIQKTGPGYVPFAHGCELDGDELALCSSDIRYYSACLCVSEFVRAFRTTPDRLPRGTWKNPYFYNGPDCRLENNTAAKMAYYGMQVLCGLHSHNDPYHWSPASALINQVADWASYLYNKRSSFADYDLFEDYGLDDNSYCYPLNPCYTYYRNASNVPGYSQVNGLWWRQIESDSSVAWTGSTFSWGYSNPKVNVKACSLPLTFGASYKAISQGELLSIILITSLVAISASAFTLKVSKAMRLKKIKKQTIRSKQLADKRKAWEEDPTNAIKLNDYAKAVDKFNRQGRIFGWGSYDAANAWINADNKGDSQPSNSPMFRGVNSKIDALSVDLSDVMAKLNAIEALIK